MMEETNGLVQSKEKYYTNDCFLFNYFFVSKFSSGYEMDIGTDLVNFVK